MPDYVIILLHYACTHTILHACYMTSVLCFPDYIITRQVTRAMHVMNRVCPRVELILKIIIILLIIFIGFIKSKPC